MKKVAIIGYLGDGGKCSDGQGVKTTIIKNELIDMFGLNEVKVVNTYKWKKNPLKLAFNCIISVITCKNIVFLTDENGVKVFPRFFVTINKFFKRKVHYYVVGGWLSDYIKEKAKVKKYISKLDAIYVELKSMNNSLKTQGLRNIHYVNKFRRLNPITVEELNYFEKPPYKLCTFSRVFKEKGIEEAIEAVNNVNNKYKENIYELDIYGAIDDHYKEYFSELMKKQNKSIAYRGIVDFAKSTETLKQYFALLFPTYYKSEGYPNTFVDAFSAGLPVIATDFKYNAEIINSSRDGIIYQPIDSKALTTVLINIYENPDIINNMKMNALKRCSEFSPEKALNVLVNNLI